MNRKALILPILVLALLSVKAVKSDFALVRDTEILINMMRALESSYVDSLSTSQLLSDATDGMARSLDPYTSYIDESGMEDFEVMTTGKYGGIGSIISQRGDYIIVTQPYKGSPADEAGLKIGDRIVEIEGESTNKMSVKDASSRLKGTPGSKLHIVVSSVLDSVERKVMLRRRRISIPAVPYYDMISDSVGYLRHSDFTDGSYDQMRGALLNLRSRSMSALILDYRGNGGGLLQEAINVLSLFVPKGSEVVSVKGRQDSMIYKTNDAPLLPNIPIVVLIDESSASAAEIVAGALQDMDRALLVGQRSFGKGLVQSTIPVGYDSFLKLTTARYHIPSGRCIQALDYTDHSNGRQVTNVADSLRKVFYTAAGREVLDGGGITPDVEIEARYVSRFAATLYAQGLIEEWGEEYYRAHHLEDIDIKNFRVDDTTFLSFKEFIKGRDVKYESNVSRAIKALERAAEEDRNEELTAEIKHLKENLSDDVMANVERYANEIKRYLEQDIILRRGYLEGVMTNSINQDEEVIRALELLTSEGELERLLHPQTK